MRRRYGSSFWPKISAHLVCRRGPSAKSKVGVRVAQRERIAKIPPDRTKYDVGFGLLPFKGRGWGYHFAILSHHQASHTEGCNTSVTEVVVATKWLIRRDPQNQRHAKFQKSSWLQTSKPLPSKSDTVFDAEVLSRASRVGQKNSRSEKSETACAQGDPAEAIFFVQRGRLRVTLISANGKEGTIA